ncbi:MAG: MBL fold metallo-hydrolase [Anaerolineae bacterium]|nr:MBL fold metallo-hydrolase [Anaerolineae bacterium]
MTKIIPLKLAMSNAFVLCGARSILIDCGGPRDLPALTRQLNRHNIHITDLALLLITHVHFDHAGSAAAIQQRAGCPLVVHRLEGDCLARGQSTLIIPVHALGRLLMPFMGAGFAPATADILIEERLDLADYGVQAEVIFTPGHTPGSLSVITSDGQALVGDLCGGGWPIGQFQPSRPRYHYWASSLEEVQASLERIFAFQPSQIYVGHGGPLDGRKAREFFLAS